MKSFTAYRAAVEIMRNASEAPGSIWSFEEMALNTDHGRVALASITAEPTRAALELALVAAAELVLETDAYLTGGSFGDDGVQVRLSVSGPVEAIGATRDDGQNGVDR